MSHHTAGLKGSAGTLPGHTVWWTPGGCPQWLFGLLVYSFQRKPGWGGWQGQGDGITSSSLLCFSLCAASSQGAM